MNKIQGFLKKMVSGTAECKLETDKKVSEGPPAVFSIKLDEVYSNKEKCIAKYAVKGHKNEVSDNKVIMVVGETGSGKTTLINAMLNFIVGVRKEGKLRYKLVIEDAAKSQAKSQTTWITAYTIPPREGFRLNYCVTIVDTPGFGDTAGNEVDRQIMEKIKHFFSADRENGIDHIDAIGFVVAANQARLTEHQQHIFNQVLSIFGKDIAENIFMLLTFADNNEPKVLVSIKEAGFSYKEYFKFNNLSFWSNTNVNPVDKYYWDMGIQNFGNLFESVRKSKSKGVDQSKVVLQTREDIESSIESVKEQIRTYLTTSENLQKQEDILKKHQREFDSNKEFSYPVSEQIAHEVKTPNNNTICPTCKYTCHEDCGKIRCFLGCKAMGWDSKCTVCPGQCSKDVHQYSNIKYVAAFKEVTKTSEEMRKRFQDASTKKLTAEQIIEELSEERKAAESQLPVLIERIKALFLRLQEIALVANSKAIVDYFDTIIADETRSQDAAWETRVRRLREYREQIKEEFDKKV